MKHDDRKHQAAVALSVVFVLIGVGWMALLQVMKPAGLVAQSQIVGDRDTGAIYARIDGRLYPALNLTSARLAVGSAAAPSWARASEIRKYPSGPMIGIPGAPDALDIAGGPRSAWAVCDRAANPARGGPRPQVTSIAGELNTAGRAAPMGKTEALLAVHRATSYVIWNGHRSRIDLADRSVTFNLGLDPGETHPIELSNALFDAIPATEPLVPPKIAESGSPSRWLPDATVGSVLETRDVADANRRFYVLLPGGVQRIDAFVADLLRTANPQGTAMPKLISPDKVIDIPAVHALDIDHYPPGKLEFVDTAANPVTCLVWAKSTGDPQAAVTVFNGRGLPVPPELETQVVPLVRDDRGADSVEADRILMLPGAANLVATTSASAVADSRESLYWVSPQGVRFGIDGNRATLQALGLDPITAVQAPWPLLRTFAAGPALSRDSALLARDTLAVGGSVTTISGIDRPPGG